MPSPAVIVTGKLESIAGGNDAGSIQATLVNFSEANPPRIGGTMLLSQIQTTVQAAGDGTFSLSLWGNYQLSPANSYYQIAIYPSSSSTAPTAVAIYQFNTAGTYDLSSTAPVITIVPSSYTPVAGAVGSVFGRPGNVVAQTGDYSYSQLSGSFGNIVIADSQAGADWGAKINAADAFLGSNAGEIWVSQAAGTSAIAADISLSVGHSLRFVQGGTFNLGTHGIKLQGDTGGGTGYQQITGSGLTKLVYTGSGDAITTGSAGLGSYRQKIDNITIQLSGASSSAVGIHIYNGWWTLISRCNILTVGNLLTSNGQIAIIRDGSGLSQGFFNIIEQTQVTGNFTTGFKSIAENACQVIGGNFYNGAEDVGSTAIDLSAGGEHRLFGTDIEAWGTGVYSNGQDNWINVRTEACLTSWKFDTSSRANIFIGTFQTSSDLGTYNMYIATPGVGESLGVKLQGIIAAGPGGTGQAPLSFPGGVGVYEDGPGSTLSLRNGLTAQELDLYSYYVSGADPNPSFLRLTSAFSGHNPGVQAVGFGTHVNPNLYLGTNGTGSVVTASPLSVAGTVGFYGASPQAKPTVTGSKAGNAALASLMTALATLGLVTDSTT